MNSSDYEKLRLKALRNELSPEEMALWRAHLRAHPEAQQDWEEEQFITQALQHLPDLPVPTNFTARVMSAVNRATRDEESPAPAPVPWTQWWGALGWSRQAALATLLLCLSLIGYRQYQLGRHAERVEAGRNLAEVSVAADLPSLELLRDFEAIRRLSPMPPEADAELAVALQ
jgi:anti-sigma factor RsiW